MHKEVKKTGSGVRISFTGAVKKQNIVSMIENCTTGNCECMSDVTKSKINNMSVSGEDGDVSLKLDGTISTQEIKEALAKSKLIN